jgi:hypothetical protein
MTDDVFDAVRRDLRAHLARRGLTVADDDTIDVLNRLAWSPAFGLDGEQLSLAELASRVGLDLEDARRSLAVADRSRARLRRRRAVA